MKPKRVISLLLTIVMILSAMPLTAFAADGTLANPITISSATELQNIAQAPNKYYKLTQNITITSSFTPIEEFNGVLDGDGYTITGVTGTTTFIYNESDRYNPDRTDTGKLFKTIGENGYVINLTLASPKLTPSITNYSGSSVVGFSLNSGILADYNYGTINNVTLTNYEITLATNGSPATRYTAAGGLVYENSGSILNSTVSGKITASQGSNIGGIVAINNGVIANTTADITYSLIQGGLGGAPVLRYVSPGVGQNNGTMYNVWVDGEGINLYVFSLDYASSYNGYAIGQNTSVATACYYKYELNTTAVGAVARDIFTEPFDALRSVATTMTESSYDNSTHNSNTTASNTLGITGLMSRTNGKVSGKVAFVEVSVTLDGETTTAYTTKNSPYALPESKDATKYILWKVGSGSTTYKSGYTLTATSSISITGTSYTKASIDEAYQKYTYDGSAKPFDVKWINTPTVFATGDSNIPVPSVSVEYSPGGYSNYSDEAPADYYYRNYSVRFTTDPVSYYYRNYDHTALEYCLEIERINISNLPVTMFTLTNPYTPLVDGSATAVVTSEKYNGLDLTFNVRVSKTRTHSFASTATSNGDYYVQLSGSGNFTGTFILADQTGTDIMFHVGTIVNSDLVITPTNSASYPSSFDLDFGVDAPAASNPSNGAKAKFYYTPDGETELLPLGDEVAFTEVTSENGNNRRAKLTVKLGTTTNASGATPTLAYGSYKFTAMYEPNRSDSVEAQYLSSTAVINSYLLSKGFVQISDFTYTLPSTRVYNGQAQGMTLPVSNNSEITVESVSYMKRTDGGPSEPAEPINPGIYDICLNFTATDNYIPQTGILSLGSFTILKATPTITLTSDKGEYVYGDDISLTATLTGVNGATIPTGTVDFFSNNGEVQVAAPLNGGVAQATSSNPTPDTYTFQATYSGDDCYNALNMIATSLVREVKKASPTTSQFDFVIPVNDVYKVDDQQNGVAQDVISVTIKSSVQGMGTISGVIYEKFISDGIWETGTTAPPVAAGRYRVSVSVTAGDNYTEGTVILSDNYVIAKKDITTDDLTCNLTGGTEYNGIAKAVSVYQKAKPDNADFTVTSTTFEKKQDDSSWQTEDPILPGEYRVLVTIPETDNFNGVTDFVAYEFEIEQAAPSLTLTFDDEDKTITYEDVIRATVTAAKSSASATQPGGTIEIYNNSTKIAEAALADIGGVMTASMDIPYNSYVKGSNNIRAVYVPQANAPYKTVNVTDVITVNPKPVVFTVSNTEVPYDGEKHSISFTTNTKLTAEDFMVTNYPIDDEVRVVNFVLGAPSFASVGRYLYYISFAQAQTLYTLHNGYTVSGQIEANLDDLVGNYGNIGIMLIGGGNTTQQKPIYFEDSVVNKYVSDRTVSNTLHNENGSSVTYRSTKPEVADVDSITGLVTIKKDGTTTIIATSSKSGSSDVYASYTLNVSKKTLTVSAPSFTVSYGSTAAQIEEQAKNIGVSLSEEVTLPQPVFSTNYTTGADCGRYEINVSGINSDIYSISYVSGNVTVEPKVLTADDFSVTAANKVYDGLSTAQVSAVVKNSSIITGDSLTVQVSGSFTSAGVDTGKTVNYTITGIGGANSGNYKLSGPIPGVTNANITKALVTVSIPKNTTYIYDGDIKSVNVLAYVNGIGFSDFSVTYKKSGNETTEPTAVGEYDVVVKLDDTNNYYTSYQDNSKLIIKSATQDVFTIEGIPEKVSYADSFKLQAAGIEAGTTVTFRITSGANIAELAADGETLKITGVGSIVVEAVATRANYNDKTARRTIIASRRALTPTASADDRFYNGLNTVDVAISLDGVIQGDKVTADASGITATSDAENDKTVFVSGITLAGDDSSKYELTTTNTQTSVTIFKAKINSFTIKAVDKSYDKTGNAQAEITGIDGVITADIPFVTVMGSANFNNAEAADGKTVTYTATGLSGSKSGNYEFKDNAAKTATDNASIKPAQVDFEIGTLSYVYDGKTHEAPVTATVNGASFKDFTIKYNSSSALPLNVDNYTLTFEMSSNYTGAPVGKILSILEADQTTMTITGLLGTIDYDKEFTLSTVGGAGNGVVTWQSSNSQVASVDASTGVVKITGTGSEVTITATKAADGNYRMQQTSVSFTPSKKAVSFKITKLSQVYDTNVKSVEITTLDGVTKSVVYTDETGKVVTPKNAGTYYVEVSATGNYEGSASAVLTISKAKAPTPVLTVSNGTYGTAVQAATLTGNAPGTTYEITYVGDGIYTAQTEVPKNAGKYTAIATVTGDNYETQTITESFTIEKRQLMVIADAQNRAYGAQNPVLTFRYEGMLSTDSIQTALISEPVATTNATPLSPAGGDYNITLTGGRSDNYYFTYVPAKLTIYAVKTPIKLYAANLSMTYDGTAKPVTLYSNDNGFTVSSSNVIVKYDGSETAPVEAGTYTVTYEIVDNDYSGSGSFTLIINNKNAAIRITGVNQIYDGTAKFISVTGAGNDYDVYYRDENNSLVTSPVNAGTYYVEVVANGNYSGTANTVMTIAKAKIDPDTVTLTMLSGTYGDNLAHASLSGNPSGTQVQITYVGDGIYTAQTEVPKNAGNYTAIATVTGNNYEELTVAKAFTIEKAVLVVGVEPASRSYGEANPTFVLNFKGWKYGEGVGVIDKLPEAKTSATVTSAADTYDILLSGGYADNYTFDFPNKGTLTVTPATSGVLYIDGSNKNVTVGDVIQLRAHYNSTMAAVTWSSSNTDVASIDEDGVVTILAAGNATITAKMKDNNYAIADATFDLSASKKNITLSAPNNILVYNRNVQDLVFISNDENFVPSDSNVIVTYTLTTNPDITTPQNVGVYSVFYQIDDERYSGSGTITMYINKADIVVKAKDMQKTYGDENPSYEVEVVKGAEIADLDYLESVSSFTCTADETGKLTPVDSYEIVLSLDDIVYEDKNINYRVSETVGTLTVNKAPLTVTVSDVERMFGRANTNPTFIISGYVNGEDSDVLDGSLEFRYNDEITAQSAVGDYKDVITANNGLISDNYNISYVYTDGTAANLKITEVPVTVSASTSRGSYLRVSLNTALADLTFEVRQNGELVEITSVVPNSTNTSYTLNGTFTVGSEYEVTVINGNSNYTLTGSPLTITPTSSSSGGGGGGGGAVVTTYYTVTFETNGGSAVESLRIVRNSTVSKPSDPSREGYTFEGWYTDEACTVAYNFTTAVTDDITLYAKWTDSSEETNPTVNPFTDVNESNWFYDDVMYVYLQELMFGVTGTTFAPNDNTTRSMIAQILYRMEGSPTVTTENPFDDVAVSEWYYDAVVWAASVGIVGGVSATSFDPGTPVTREQLATMLYRYASYKGYTFSENGSSLQDYTDADSVSDYAQEAFDWAVSVGLISGRTETSVVPHGTATRAEIAAMLHRLLGKLSTNI